MKRGKHTVKTASDEGIVIHCPECDAEVLTIDLKGMEIGIDAEEEAESEEAEDVLDDVEVVMDKKSYLKNLIAKLDSAAEVIEKTNPKLARRLDRVSNELEARLEVLE